MNSIEIAVRLLRLLGHPKAADALDTEYALHESMYRLTVSQRDAAWREGETLKARLDAIKAKSGIDSCFDGNPENHTLAVTLFYGETNPCPLVELDEHSRGSLTDKLIDALVAKRGAGS